MTQEEKKPVIGQLSERHNPREISITADHASEASILKNPSANEDYVMVSIDSSTFVVADGVGGHRDGALASRTSCDYIREQLKQDQELLKKKTITERVEYFENVVSTAHTKVVELSPPTTGRQYGRELLTKPGTTLTLCHLFFNRETKTHELIVVSCGDSRLYQFYNSGNTTFFQALSKDDGITAQMGESDERYGRAAQYFFDHYTSVANKENQIYEACSAVGLKDPDKVRTAVEYFGTAFKWRNDIDNYLGSGEFRAPKGNVVAVEGKGRYRLLLCSDGIHDNLTNEQIMNIFRESDSLSDQELAALFVAEAKKVSADTSPDNPRKKPDDMTAVVVSITIQ